MGRLIDCAQIVLTFGAAWYWRSVALQPGQPLPGVLDFGQARDLPLIPTPPVGLSVGSIEVLDQAIHHVKVGLFPIESRPL